MEALAVGGDKCGEEGVDISIATCERKMLETRGILTEKFRMMLVMAAWMKGTGRSNEDDTRERALGYECRRLALEVCRKHGA